jgi:UDPglucose 6-dehydrogenase
MRIGIIGAGYVGLVAAACLAESGHRVTCVEREPTRLEPLLQGRAPFHEPGLDVLLARNLAAGRLRLAPEVRTGVADADVVFLAVGTPAGPDGCADDRDLTAAALQVAEAASGPLVVVVKSTAPVGTNRRLASLLAGRSPHRLEVVSNPEFLREGSAVRDFLFPDRVVIGASTAWARSRVRAVYTRVIADASCIQCMDPESAELAKYAANAMLAMRVAFVNDLSRLCEAVGADVDALSRAVGSDRRIGPEFLRASLGYGGSCFPKDLQALAASGRALGEPQHLVEATHAANLRHRERTVTRLARELGGLRGRTVAVWGLAFKAGTDDLRDSPAMQVSEAVLARGGRVRGHDPLALGEARRRLGVGFVPAPDPVAALADADALVIGTAWAGYRNIGPPDIARHLGGRVVVDGRNLFSPRAFADTGLRYLSIGRPDHGPAESRAAVGS